MIFEVYFSATGNTKKVTHALAGFLSEHLALPVKQIDLTPKRARESTCRFGPEDLVIVGMPVYAGKLPNKILPFVKSGLSGENTAAIPVVTYGNRSYDNALAELYACLKADGFRPVAAGAFVGRHAFSDTLAAGRPDSRDRENISAFADAVSERICRAGEFSKIPLLEQVPGDADAPYYTPLGQDGRPAVFLKAVVKTDPGRCDDCGKCASLCPMGSISPEDFRTVTGICIKCHACVRGCPQNAKYFDDPAFLSHRAMLEETYVQRKEAEWF